VPPCKQVANIIITVNRLQTRKYNRQAASKLLSFLLVAYLAYRFTLRMEVIFSSETSVILYLSARCYALEYTNMRRCLWTSSSETSVIFLTARRHISEYTYTTVRKVFLGAVFFIHNNSLIDVMYSRLLSVIS
jgi:hypothetical protein